ncbi:hypothetical protein F0U59_08165 [Archangium gephyra]|nr:hypothetical protein F0U59_08165 [Archangium gephyra]
MERPLLLDLNLPGIGGQEVLALLEADPVWRTLPNSSLFKPADAVGMQEAARALECFWFSAARLPGLEESTG